jgi:Na+(H+)/acetate symporter ActP
MLGSMLILTWVGIIFVIILHVAIAQCKIMTNIMPTHVKISIEPGIRELFRF